MEDLHYYTTISQYDLAESIQAAVQRGWVFTFEAGERKFHSNIAKAMKGDHVFYDCNGWDDMFRKIMEVDFPQPSY